MLTDEQTEALRLLRDHFGQASLTPDLTCVDQGRVKLNAVSARDLAELGLATFEGLTVHLTPAGWKA